MRVPAARLRPGSLSSASNTPSHRSRCKRQSRNQPFPGRLTFCSRPSDPRPCTISTALDIGVSSSLLRSASSAPTSTNTHDLRTGPSRTSRDSQLRVRRISGKHTLSSALEWTFPTRSRGHFARIDHSGRDPERRCRAFLRLPFRRRRPDEAMRAYPRL
jgi:hypothetical protein